MEKMILMYILAGILWTFYATRKQISQQLNQDYNREFGELIMCIILNFCFWPIAIAIATCRNV